MLKKIIVRSKTFASIMIIVLMFTVFVSTTVYSAKETANIGVEVKAGFDGVARLGAYIPYKVLLVNKGRAAEGEVQIEVKVGSQSKTIFAKPFSLPEGSIKEVTITAPVFTARRGITVKISENGKVIKEVEYSFIKLVPPEMRTIGVLSSDNAAYNFLNGIMIPGRYYGEYDEKMKMMQASGVYSNSPMAVTREEGVLESKTESILIPMTNEEFPEDIEVMDGFDILIVSNFDTSTLTKKQLDVLHKWVQNGGNLVLGTGSDWKKVYGSLPQELKKFTITEEQTIEVPTELADFSGITFSGNPSLNIVSGLIGFDNDVIIGNEMNPLAIKYIYQQGRILFLTFDPGLEPINSWDGKQAFWENLLSHGTNSQHHFRQRDQGYYYSNTNNINNLTNLTQRVPEDKKPPLLFMFITIAIYIIIVGPLMYIILKKKDKRDLNWIAVPVIAMFCLGVIYVAGFSTRYKTAVLNTVSMINLDLENQKADITTGMGVFNNKKGNLTITYAENSNIDFDVSESRYGNYYGSYSGDSDPEGKLVSKLILSDPIVYELYDVAMWEPRSLTARKNEPFSDKLISSVEIKDGKFKAVIKNTTKYEFMDAFLSVGSNFMYVGDILPGTDKIVEENLDSQNVHKNVEEYLDARYGRLNYSSSIKPPADFLEKRRKREIIQSLLVNQYHSLRGQTKIGLYALNSQDMGYELDINGKRPQFYHTNGIFASIDMVFEKGKEVEIPTGLIAPYIEQDIDSREIASRDDYNQLRVRGEGDIDFTYELPNNIEYNQFSLEFDTYVPLYIKYNMEDRKDRDENFQGKILQNKYEYYLYNISLNEWEKIEEKHSQINDIAKYINNENRLKVRIKVVEIADPDSQSGHEYIEFERLLFPEIQLKGVVK